MEGTQQEKEDIPLRKISNLWKIINMGKNHDEGESQQELKDKRTKKETMMSF